MEKVMDTTNAHAAIKCWVELYSDQLFSWALHQTSNKEVAEDLVQETFMAAVMGFEKLENSTAPKAWLFAILNHKIADYYRQVFRTGQSHNASLSDFFSPEGDWLPGQRPQKWAADQEQHLLDNHEFGEALSQCLKNLPHYWRAALLLKFIEGQESAKICQELQISATNYWQILHRAKLQLRKCLELNWFGK